MSKIKLVSLVAVLLVAGVLLAFMFFSGFSPAEYMGGSCDIKDYKIIKIGEQIWMAQNLNCYVIGSKCYNDDPANCAKYGRLYDWSMALALPSKCNSASCANQVNAHHRGVCPADWHIPSSAEWEALYSFAGDTIADGIINTSDFQENPTAGKRLKAKDSWSDCGPPGDGKTYLCEDDFGFCALPGGIGNAEGFFSNMGGYSFWWSIDEHDHVMAYGRGLTYNSDHANWFNHNKNHLLSVRCLRD